MSLFKDFAHLEIPIEVIRSGTNYFADEFVIGQTISSKVYEGSAQIGEQKMKVAIRRIDNQFDKRGVELLTEISMLSHLNHENIVSMVGFCYQNTAKIIVYKHVMHGSLDKYVSDPTLTWLQRLNICVGVARALSYIHREDVGRNYGVIHRNIKSSKILLDDKWEAKLSGFGLSIRKPATRKNRLLLSPVCGTHGYIDPVYKKTGGVTDKSDVYSFGVVLFEVLCGRLSVVGHNDEKESFLAPLAKLRYEEGKLDEMIVSDLRKQMEPQALNIFSEIAYQCLKEQRAHRPGMDHIVGRLEKALEFQRKHENTEHPAALAVEGTSKNSKVRNLEYLKISLEEIKLATENFDKKNKIGGGGYGEVYKAKLNHFDHMSSLKGVTNSVLSSLSKTSSNVAIKRLVRTGSGQGEQEFLTEIEMLTSCKHRNIVSLLGFCDEGTEMILVYELSCNGSLDMYLGSNASMNNLTWEQRVRICLDVAHGLHYLHTETGDKHRVVHRDMKSANILLGKNWEAKIADFGLSRIGPANQQLTYVMTNVVGTPAYCDPEYARIGMLTKESDIYSFGVVLFEVLCGRLAYDLIYNVNNGRVPPSMARQCFKQRKLHDIIDPRIKGEADESFFTMNKGANEDSLDTFSKIAYQCIAETQGERPTMEVVIEELEKALQFQVNRTDILKISLKDIKTATEDFDSKNLLGKGAFGNVYEGKVLHANRHRIIAVKRHVVTSEQGEHEFLNELDILFEYKHKNVIGLVGYCNEMDEKIIVYEHASNGSLDKYLNDASLTWTKRLEISIDVARGLDFLHRGVGSQERVIHRDIKSANILLNHDHQAKITDFGLSIISPINQQLDYVISQTAGTMGYVDPRYLETGIISKESDIYSFGVVLFEIMTGRQAFFVDDDTVYYRDDWFKRSFEKGKLDEIIFDGIKAQIVRKSLRIFSTIAHKCLDDEREKRPTAGELVVQLKKALEFQEDYDIWEPKLPKDYKEIIHMSLCPEIYSIEKKKNLYTIFSQGILLQEGKVWFWLSKDGNKNEMIPATLFSYKNPKSLKWRSIQKSRFRRVGKILDISNMNIQIKIKTQLLSPNVTYGIHLVFKFCDPRKRSSKPMYVNLKYKLGANNLSTPHQPINDRTIWTKFIGWMGWIPWISGAFGIDKTMCNLEYTTGSETLHAYFATWRDDGWMTIELCRFLCQNKTTNIEVLLESFSRYYCGCGAIYVEGIEFQAIDNVKHEDPWNFKEQQTVLKSNSNMSSDGDEMFFSPSEVNAKKFHMLPAKMVLYDSSDLKCFDWNPPNQSRDLEVVEVLAQQVFRIKCNIETQMLSTDTNYACYLVYKLSERCRGLQCPVRVRDVLLRKNKETEFIYFRTPSPVNLCGIKKVPEKREDGWMEVIVWEFKSSSKFNDDHLLMHLKLRCYEGTMSGLIVCGIEFRPM